MATETLRPNTAGDLAQFSQYPVSGENWDKVDEAVSDGDATYVHAHNVAAIDFYNISDPTFPDAATIISVMIWYRIKRYDATYLYGYVGIRSGITDNWSFSGGSVDWSLVNRYFTTDPNTGVAWTKAAIAALQVGFKMIVGGNMGLRATQVYIWVDYTVAVAHEKTLTESLGLVDKVVKTPSIVKTEPLGLVDAVVKAPSVVKAEPLGLVDTYGKTWAIYRTYTELLGLTDTVIATRLLVKVLIELLGLSDTVRKDTFKMLTENLGLLDVYGRTWAIYRTYDELLGLTDSIQKDIALHPLVEPLGLADSIVKSTSVTRDELLGLKDSIAKDTSVTRTELLGLVDTITKDISLPLSEVLGLLDTHSRTLTIHKTFTETLGLDDRVSKHVSLHALTEVLGLLDSISYSKNPTTLAKLIRKYLQLVDIGGGGEE